MRRALAFAFGAFAVSWLGLATVDLFHAMDRYAFGQWLDAHPDAPPGAFLALEAQWFLARVGTAALIAGVATFAVLACTRRLSRAHERAVLVSVALLGAGVVMDVLGHFGWRDPGNPWGPLAVTRMLPFLAVPVALTWPHASARWLALAGAALVALRTLALGWADAAYVHASGFTSAGAPIPPDTVWWLTLPFAVGFLAYDLLAAAFALAAWRVARGGRAPGSPEPAPAPPRAGSQS